MADHQAPPGASLPVSTEAAAQRERFHRSQNFPADHVGRRRHKSAGSTVNAATGVLLANACDACEAAPAAASAALLAAELLLVAHSGTELQISQAGDNENHGEFFGAVRLLESRPKAISAIRDLCDRHVPRRAAF